MPPGNLVVPDSFFFQFVWFRVCCSFFSRVRLGDLLCSPQQTRLHCRYAPSEARQHHYLLPALQLSHLTKGDRLGDYRAEVTAVLKSEVRSTASRQSPLEESASQARQDGRSERTTGAVWQVCESGPASVEGWQEAENKKAHPEGNASPFAHQHLFPIRYGFCFGTASSIHATWRRAGARTGLGQSGDCCGCRLARASFMFQSCSKHISQNVFHMSACVWRIRLFNRVSPSSSSDPSLSWPTSTLSIVMGSGPAPASPASTSISSAPSAMGWGDTLPLEVPVVQLALQGVAVLALPVVPQDVVLGSPVAWHLPKEETKTQHHTGEAPWVWKSDPAHGAPVVAAVCVYSISIWFQVCLLAVALYLCALQLQLRARSRQRPGEVDISRSKAKETTCSGKNGTSQNRMTISEKYQI